MPNRTTETATFRFDKELLENLKKISEHEHISLNVVVSQILDSYVHWQISAPDAGWIVMIKSFLVELIKEVDDDKISHLATKSSKKSAKNIALLMRGNFDEDDWIDIIKQRAQRSGFKFLEFSKDKKIEYVMHHDMGIKWSIYFITFYENLFHELNIPIIFDYTGKLITMILEKHETNSS